MSHTINYISKNHQNKAPEAILNQKEYKSLRFVYLCFREQI